MVAMIPAALIGFRQVDPILVRQTALLWSFQA